MTPTQTIVNGLLEIQTEDGTLFRERNPSERGIKTYQELSVGLIGGQVKEWQDAKLATQEEFEAALYVIVFPAQHTAMNQGTYVMVRDSSPIFNELNELREDRHKAKAEKDILNANLVYAKVAPDITWHGDRRDPTETIMAEMRELIEKADCDQKSFPDEDLKEAIFKARSAKIDQIREILAQIGGAIKELEAEHDINALPSAKEAARQMKEYNDLHNGGGGIDEYGNYECVPHVTSREDYEKAKADLDKYSLLERTEQSFLEEMSEVSDYVIAQKFEKDEITLINAQGRVSVLRREEDEAEYDWRIDDYAMDIEEAHDIVLNEDWEVEPSGLWDVLAEGKQYYIPVEDPRSILPRFDELNDSPDGTLMIAGMMGEATADLLQYIQPDKGIFDPALAEEINIVELNAETSCNVEGMLSDGREYQAFDFTRRATLANDIKQILLSIEEKNEQALKAKSKLTF